MSEQRTAPQGNGAERQQVAVVAQANPAHGLVPQNFDQAIRFAELMARSKMVPKHFQGKPEECLVIIEQAMRWEMSPYAVIQCASMIHDRPMYEGKLVAAVVNSRGPRFGLQDRLRYRYEGQGPTRKIIVSGVLGRREEAIEVVWKDAKTSNEQWVKQPDQQLAYHGARVWARRHMPELMLGVYSAEEFDSNGVPVDDFTGETIEGQRELPPVATDQPFTQTVTHPLPADTPKAGAFDDLPPDWRDYMDKLKAKLDMARDEAEVTRFGKLNSVTHGLAKGPPGVPKMIEELLADAYERVRVKAPDMDDDGSDAAEPGSLDEVLPPELRAKPETPAE